MSIPRGFRRSPGRVRQISLPMAGDVSRALLAAPRTMAAIASADLPKYLTRDEVGRLLLTTGRARRVSELLALTAYSIDWHAQVIHARTLKRREHLRAIPLRPPLLGELARHIAGAGISGDRRLFGVTRQRVHQIVSRAARGQDSRRTTRIRTCFGTASRAPVCWRACRPDAQRVAGSRDARGDVDLHQDHVRRVAAVPRRRRLRIARAAASKAAA